MENGGPERNKGKDREFKKDSAVRDFKRAKKEKEPVIEKSADSSGNWRNSSSNSSSSSKKDGDGKGGERQSAVRPRSDNNRAARRAEKH